MRAAVFEKVKSPLIVRNDYPNPNLSESQDQVIVDLTACGICHTDLGFLDHGVPTGKSPPLVLGHEMAGIVREIGNKVTTFKEGDRVLIPAVISCGSCYHCRTGRENICSNQTFFGSSVDGGFAEQIMVPAKDIFHLPAQIPLEEGCIIADAVSTPYHAVKNRGQVKPGDWAVVFGCGGIGLNVVQNIKAAGGLPIAVDVKPEKLEIAKTLGAVEVISANELDERGIVGAIRKATNGGADIAFEAIGNPVTFKQAFNSLRTGGRLVAVGYSPKRWDGFDIGRVMFREMEIMGSLGCRTVDYHRIIELVKNGNLVVKPLVTGKYTLSEVNEGFDVLRRGEGVRTVILCQK
ncbi:MAG: zinc-binding dehydrogenase [Candidatus Hodarchaeales archaeon]